MSELATPPIPSLFLSERFTEQGVELGLEHVQVSPGDVAQVIYLARHGTIQNLGGLMIHGSGERTGGRGTRYHSVHPFEPAAMPRLDGIVTRQDILKSAQQNNVEILALRGTSPSEPNLSLALYRAARKWREPGSQAGGGPDTWFSIAIGGVLGLVSYSFADGFNTAPTDPTTYAYAAGVGAAIGGFSRPLLQKAREHYDTRKLKTLRPVSLT